MKSEQVHPDGRPFREDETSQQKQKKKKNKNGKEPSEEFRLIQVGIIWDDYHN